jgi:hypothetical protein
MAYYLDLAQIQRMLRSFGLGYWRCSNFDYLRGWPFDLYQAISEVDEI